jgi:Tfp pilus assembly protein PilN
LNFARRPFRDERPLWFFGGLALAVALLFFAANVRQLLRYGRQVADIREEIAALERREGAAASAGEQAREAIGRFAVSTLAAESRELNRIVEERRFSWLDLLGRLERTLPGEVRLARLTPKVAEDGSVALSLSLVGRGSASVVRTLEALSRDPLFSQVELHSEQSQEEGVPEGRSFEVRATYRPAGRVAS